MIAITSTVALFTALISTLSAASFNGRAEIICHSSRGDIIYSIIAAARRESECR